MINIKPKVKFLLWVIIIFMTIITIIGFMCCQHEYGGTIETEKRIIKETVEEDERTIEIETDKDGDTNQAIEPVSLGEFKLTAYCSCVKCCGKWALNRPIDENDNEIVYGSIGERLTEGYSIAVDPRVIPYGTEVVINGHTYKAQDCGGAIKGNRIDVYISDHNRALEFGVKYAEVFMVSN